MRVNVELINAVNDLHLWANAFDLKLTDNFSVVNEIAKAVAEQLRTSTPTPTLTSTPTVTPTVTPTPQA